MRNGVIAVVGLMLAACAAGPGKGDVEQALAGFFEQTAGTRPTFEGLEVGRCQKAEGGPGYACAVSGQARFAVNGRVQQEPLTGTFVFDRVGDQWKVVGTR